MLYTINLLGLDTYEVFPVGQARAASVLDWPIEKYPGPTIHYRVMGENTDRILYLYPQHLKLLYNRFKLANPTGIEKGWDDWYAAIPGKIPFGQNTSETLAFATYN